MKKTIDELRKEIDLIDRELLKSFSKRINLVKEIGIIKKKEGLGLLNEKRREEVINKWKLIAEKENISRDFVEKIYKILHDYSLEIENK